MKKLIPTVALALMGAAAVTGSTYAWFSMNKSVEATGMKVKATTSGALIIGKTVSTISGIEVDFEDASATVLSHSTHGDVEGTAAEDKTGLKTITDSVDVVDPVTGMVSGTATWREAINGSGEGAVQYYKDYTFFVASAGEKMSNKLIMSMTNEMKIDIQKNWAYNMSTKTAGMGDTKFGFTVDAYSAGLRKSTDTTDLAYTYITNGTYHLDDVNATLDLGVTEIPSSVDENGVAQGLAFKLRVYLDGDYWKNTVSFKTTGDSKAVAGKAYFSVDGDGNYTAQTVVVGETTVSSFYEVDALGTPATDKKYVHTEKANTSDLDLGFKFEAGASTAA